MPVVDDKPDGEIFGPVVQVRVGIRYLFDKQSCCDLRKRSDVESVESIDGTRERFRGRSRSTCKREVSNTVGYPMTFRAMKCGTVLAAPLFSTIKNGRMMAGDNSYEPAKS
jgi:hypothetical protein